MAPGQKNPDRERRSAWTRTTVRVDEEEVPHREVGANPVCLQGKIDQIGGCLQERTAPTTRDLLPLLHITGYG